MLDGLAAADVDARIATGLARLGVEAITVPTGTVAERVAFVRRIVESSRGA